MCAINNPNSECVQILLNHPKVNIFFQDRMKRSAMHCAAKNNDVQTIIQLKNRGLSISAPSKRSGNPLEVAIMEGNVDAVKLLMYFGEQNTRHLGTDDPALFLFLETVEDRHMIVKLICWKIFKEEANYMNVFNMLIG
jgi:ankyrin repeat protein